MAGAQVAQELIELGRQVRLLRNGCVDVRRGVHRLYGTPLTGAATAHRAWHRGSRACRRRSRTDRALARDRDSPRSRTGAPTLRPRASRPRAVGARSVPARSGPPGRSARARARRMRPTYRRGRRGGGGPRRRRATRARTHHPSASARGRPGPATAAGPAGADPSAPARSGARMRSRGRSRRGE